MTNVIEYRSLYFDQSLNASLPSELIIIEVSPLLKALVERMAFWPWDKPQNEQTNTTALFLEELHAAKEELLQLPLPTDRRLQHWLIQLNAPDYIAPPPKPIKLVYWGQVAKPLAVYLTKKQG